MTHDDEWRAALHGDPATNRDNRPDPADYAGSADGPSDAVYSATDDVAKAMRWGDPICPSCQRNELTFVEPICGECIADMEQEEAHDRSRAGEWHD